MDEHKPANPYLPPNGSTNSDAFHSNGTIIPSPTSPQMSFNNKKSRSGGWLNATLQTLAVALSGFVVGIFFTIYMQNNSLSGTPLETVQRPILELSNIPADAHPEWISLQQSFKFVDRYFYEKPKINHKDMIYQAAEAAINSLGDVNTAFNRPVVAKANSDFLAGRFVGVGISPEIKDGRYIVKRTIPTSSAEKAGILPGDVLYAINGAPPPNLTDDNAAVSVSEKLRGEVGTKVKVTFQRPSDNNRETEYELTRTELMLPSVEARLLPNNLVHIEMTRVFGDNTIKEFDERVGALAKNNPAGYILDLRGNGGGSVEAAKQLLGRFLDGGIAYYEDSPANNVSMRPVNVITSSDIKLYDKPLVVLVNGGSASSSEIVTGALRDRERATLIGEKTFGKGSAQYIVKLEGKSALRVTYEYWFTPNKVNVYNSKGLKPDIEVVPTDTQRKLSQDPQLDRAIQFLTEKAKS